MAYNLPLRQILILSSHLRLGIRKRVIPVGLTVNLGWNDNLKKITHRKITIIWKPIAQTLYIKRRLFIMNKAMSVQSFTYLGVVVSEKNVPKNWLI